MVKVAKDWRTATLDSRERAMLEYSEKLTFTPGQLCEADVEELRIVGFSDREVLG